MNTLIYMLAACVCSGLGFHSWSTNRTDTVRIAFAIVACLTGLSYLGFSFYLLPSMDGGIYLHSLAGCLIPVSFLWFLERLFGRIHQPMGTLVRRLWIATPMVGAFYLMADTTIYHGIFQPSLADIIFTTYIMSCFGLCLYRLHLIHQESKTRLQRVRIRYLMVLLGGCVFFTLLELLLRGYAGAELRANMSDLGLITRSSVLQGAAPPIGTLFGTLFIYFLHQIVQLHRLLDLNEIFSRIFTLGILAILLVIINGLAGLWLTNLGAHRGHLAYQLFLSTAIFLSVYDPLRDRVHAKASQLFTRHTHQLDLSMSAIENRITKVITMDDLTTVLLDGLQTSGRVPLISLYLWDHEKSAFRLKRQRGRAEHPLMQTIAQKPFTEGFTEFGPNLSSSLLRHRIRRKLPGFEMAKARLRTMEAMGAELTICVRSGDLILGWLNLSSVEWFEGFTPDEIRRLSKLAGRVAIVLENIYSFEEAESQARLAAMGTMAAGLAHEIRNPLAGIKGAAQYLQDSVPNIDSSDMEEFLDVIVDEADRLNVVVSQFLDYARPFEIHAIHYSTGKLVDGVVDLVKKAELPPDIVIETDLSSDLPLVRMDPDRMRQVLLNLVNNAVQAIHPAGKVTIRTGWGRSTLKANRGVMVAEITVTDDGIGIAPDDMKKLFIPFFTTKKTGTGLGLPISQRLVEAHGGEINVFSKRSQGTTFVVHLPVEHEPENIPSLEFEFSEDDPTEAILHPKATPLTWRDDSE